MSDIVYVMVCLNLRMVFECLALCSGSSQYPRLQRVFCGKPHCAGYPAKVVATVYDLTTCSDLAAVVLMHLHRSEASLCPP